MHANHKRQSLSRSLATLMTLTSVFSSGGCARLYHMMHYNCVSEALHEQHRSYYHSPETGRIIAKEHHPNVCPVELPCYGYEPTCWRKWPEECVGCPPDTEVIPQGTIIEQPAAPIVPPHAAVRQPTPAQQQPAPIVMPTSPADAAPPTDDATSPVDDIEAPADLDSPAIPAAGEGTDVPLPDDSALPGASNQPAVRSESGPVAARNIQRLDEAFPLNDEPMLLAAAQPDRREPIAAVEEVFESAIQQRAQVAPPVAIEVEEIEVAAPEVADVDHQAIPEMMPAPKSDAIEREPVAAPDLVEEAKQIAKDVAFAATDAASSTLALAGPREMVAPAMPVDELPATDAIAESVDATFVEKQSSPVAEASSAAADVALNSTLTREDKIMSQKDEDPNAAMVDAVTSEEEKREVPRFKIAAVLPVSSQPTVASESNNISSTRLQVNSPATIRFVNKRAEEAAKAVAKKPASSGIRFR